MEAGKGDDPCVTFETPCDICASFTDDQMKKIQHRKRYLKKQKADFYCATIAYHVGLIAVLGWPQGIMANV